MFISLAAPFSPISVFLGGMPLENIDIRGGGGGEGGLALNSMKIATY